MAKATKTGMVPPWEAFPIYERYTIGWRMGSGEGYLLDWHASIDNMPKDYESRLEYLKFHRPAPLSWGSLVCRTLYPESTAEHTFDCSQPDIDKLLHLGVIEYDAAYQTWLLQQQMPVKWPWLGAVRETPEKAARYGTREFWYFSRQVSAIRGHGEFKAPAFPSEWRHMEQTVLSGRVGEINPENGLMTLARMLCAGSIVPPWELGLTIESCTKSFRMDMNYSEAFKLWVMCAFDDHQVFWDTFSIESLPKGWLDWVNENPWIATTASKTIAGRTL
jgi:hypothetical protein